MREASGQRRGSVGPRSSGLATDLYQLTMGAAYFASGRGERASFEMFVRRLPEERSYLLVAGVEQALGYLEGLSFSGEEIEYLRGLPVFSGVSGDYFEYLREFRFTGEVWGMPEGTVAFGGEPLLRVTAPLIEAQLVETFLLATINFQTMIATKASRVVEAAAGRGVIEFGARRCHGFGAAVAAARAAYVGGCIGTSNVEAGRMYDIPVFGTAAHSFTMAFEHEIDAFRAYTRVFPESTTLLLDTYDVIHAARLATEFGPALRGVRLDSGDLVAQSREVRAILDAAGMEGTRILASGDLNEYLIERMVADGARIDSFGVGTELSTSRDAPALSGVYKLVEVESDGHIEPKMKLSREKATYPHRKQVWRERDEAGRFVGDVIGMAGETGLPGDPLLVPVMREGRTLEGQPDLEAIRRRAGEQLAGLPAAHKRLRGSEVYPVRYSEELERRRARMMAALEEEVRSDSVSGMRRNAPGA
ncbi:MAG: nicotinate phosphoribosyltransferase [Blastocatellia bacterium]|nr:nicotinate phosphoribosyltransferase [Blastocatellia bacterium]